jgi:hypothetical protein
VIHRQNAARPRVDHDRRRDLEVLDPLGQDPVDLALERQVDRHVDVVARAGRVEGDHLYLAPRRVDLGLLLADRPAQVVLEARLDAALAEAVGRPVLAVRAPAGGQLRLGDLADVAEQVARQRAVHVLADRLRLDRDARQLEVALLDRVGGLGIGRDAQRHPGEGVGLRAGDLPAEVRRAAADQLGQPPEDDLGPPRQVGRQDGDGERRSVAQHRDAVAVVDEAALSRHRHHAQAIVVGLVAVLGATHDLELEQASRQRQRAERAADA